MIVSPVRNRAWVLPDFLAALDGLNYPPDCISYHFLVNDCIDATAEVLRNWTASRSRATVEELDTHVQGWNRYAWPRYSYVNLALLRNHLLDRFLGSDAAYLFSVDSDVIVPAHGLRELIAANRAVVAGVISNLPGLPPEASPIHNFLFRAGEYYRHEAKVPDGLFEVDLTGAAILIRRDVIATGVRYRGTRSGEDASFCEQVQAKGFQLWCHGGVRCQHRMEDPQHPMPSRGVGARHQGIPQLPTPVETAHDT